MVPLKLFVSYTQTDRQWAEWIAWQAEATGHSVRLQAWDFGPGKNFLHEIQEASKWSDVTVMVLSEEYLASNLGKAEWYAAYAQDPVGETQKLLPIRVRPCTPTGLLTSVVDVDLVGEVEDAAREKVLAALGRGRGKPSAEPAFPGRPSKPEAPFPPTAPAIPPATPSAVMIGVPHRNPFFTGRGDLLATLHDRLLNEGGAALAQAAIHGLGGIGKTQTAIEYAYRFAKDYQTVLWVAAEDVTAVETSYSMIAQRLGLLGVGTTDLEALALAVRGWLARETDWLLIFDNADDPEILREYLPKIRTGGKVLLTSRADVFSVVGVRNPLNVETMEPEDAVGFLRDRTGRDEPEAAYDLAQELGYLPLALEQAAAYIETVKVSLSDYLERFRKQGLEILEKGGTSTPYRSSVAKTWLLSIERVRAEAPASAELLNAAAFLVPDSIPVEIFTIGGTAFRGELAKALESAADEPLVFWEVLAPLERYSLVERLENEAFKLHRLTQAVIKGAQVDESRSWANQVVEALSKAYPSPSDFSNWRACERLQASAIAVYRTMEEYSLETVAAGRLLNEAGYYAKMRGDLHSSCLFRLKSLEIRDHVLGTEHPDTLASMNNLATTLRDLGDLSGARRMHEKVLVIHQRVLGGEHPDTLTSMNNLATIFRALGDLDGARRMHEKVLEIRERRLNGEHPDTLRSLSNLATTRVYLGDLAGARDLHEKVLEIRARLLSVEHPDMLNSMNNLALTLRDLGDLGGARQMHEKVLAIRERLFGSEHPSTTNSMWNLFLTVRELGDTKAEINLIEKLRWLLSRDEDEIASAMQRDIRQKLLELVAEG